MKTSITLGLSALALALAMAPVQNAAAVEYQQNASGSCNGALPIFEQNLRFRPVGILNVGDGNAFISCSGMNLFGNAVTTYGARINNTTADPVDVSCTLVNGRQSGAFPEFFPKTQTFAPGANAFIIWSAAADNGGTNFQDLVNLSCISQPGVNLLWTAIVTVAPL